MSKLKIFCVFSFLLLIHIKASIIYKNNLSISVGTTNIDFHEQNFATLSNYNSSHSLIYQYAAATFKTYYFVVPGTKFQIRSLLQQTVPSNVTIILFNSSILLFSLPGTYIYAIKLKYNSQSFINSCFFNSTLFFFVLIKNSTTNPSYVVQIYKNITLLSSTTLSFNSSFLNDKILYFNNVLYISFQTGIQIYHISSTLTFSKLTKISYFNTTLNHIDMSIDKNFICYSTNFTITLLYHNNYTVYWSINLTQNVIGIKLMNKTYIIATTVTKIYQIDYQQKIIINSTVMRVVGNFSVGYYAPTNQIMLFYDNPLSNTYLQVYSLTSKYSTPNTTCLQTYNYNSANCIKNLQLALNISYTTNNINNTNIQNPNITNTTNVNNISDYINIENIIPIILIINNNQIEIQNNQTLSSSSLSDALIDKLNNTAMVKAVDVLGKSMALSSMRITPTFLLSFTGFLDDLWYYRYHRTEYPKSVQFLMQQVNVMNELRLNPWFLKFMSFINQNSVCIQENQNMYEYLQFNSTDPNTLYFLNSAQDTYKGNLIMNVLFLITLKILYLLISKIHNIIFYRINQVKQLPKLKNQILETNQQLHTNNIEEKNNSIKKSAFKKYVINTLKYNTEYWLIFNAVLEINMLKLTFNCFNQMQLPSCLYFFDKVNILATLIILLTLLLYCICYYPLVYSFKSKLGSQILLTRTKFELSSFYLESIFIVTRNFVRSIVHSLFIANYQLQISILTGLDIFFVLFAMKMWKFFLNKVIAILSILYSLVFFSFDIFFAIKAKIDSKQLQKIKEDYSTIVVIILALVSLSISVSLLFLLIFNLCKHIIHKFSKKTMKNQKGNMQVSKNISKTSKSNKNRPIIKVIFFDKQLQKNIKTRKLERIANQLFTTY